MKLQSLFDLSFRLYPTVHTQRSRTWALAFSFVGLALAGAGGCQARSFNAPDIAQQGAQTEVNRGVADLGPLERREPAMHRAVTRSFVLISHKETGPECTGSLVWAGSTPVLLTAQHCCVNWTEGNWTLKGVGPVTRAELVPVGKPLLAPSSLFGVREKGKFVILRNDFCMMRVEKPPEGWEPLVLVSTPYWPTKSQMIFIAGVGRQGEAADSGKGELRYGLMRLEPRSWTMSENDVKIPPSEVIDDGAAYGYLLPVKRIPHSSGEPSKTGAALCLGDSGAPLLVHGPNSSAVVAGVYTGTSREGCESGKVTGYYSFLGSRMVLNWLKDPDSAPKHFSAKGNPSTPALVDGLQDLDR